jgi:hypothetical protein
MRIQLCGRVIRSFFAKYNVPAIPGCGVIKLPPVLLLVFLALAHRGFVAALLPRD